VPFISTLGLSVEESRPGQVVLRLPLATANLAHGGVLHTATLFAVGEIAAGVAIGTHPRLAPVTKLLKASRIEYLAPSGKDVTAHAMVTAEMVQAVLNGVERDGKAQVEIPVQLMDGHGKDVAEVVCVYTFKT
jgi:acyl-coenzyme A thioesterase PaaI-like protein